MGFLKGLATGFLSLLFFLVLVVFSVAFMLHGTVLSADFVNKQVDDIPISSIASDFAEKQIADKLPEGAAFLKDVALNIIEAKEPWIKTQIKDAINTGYDYFNGKTDTLDISISLTDIKSDLSVTFWDQTKTYFQQQLAGKSESEISAYFQNIIQQIPQDAIPQELASLMPNLRNLAIEQYLREFAGQATITIPGLPAESYASIEASAKEYFDSYLAGFIDDIPDSYAINESTIGHDTMKTLQDVRRGIGYFQTYYLWTIVVLVVLAALIFLVNMNIKTPARSLGINLIFFGAIDLAGIIIMKSLPVLDWASSSLNVDIPAGLNTWITNTVNNVSAVGLPLSIGILVAGVALLVVSFFFNNKSTKPA